MYMRIVWGKILPGKWNEFEVAFKTAMTARGEVKGLKDHWLARDQNDANAGFSITLLDYPGVSARFGRTAAMNW